ncbi:MAG: carbon-nitrogen hydrolase family protein [Opitutaceae bacterium]|nr:carbon-nitrogen hydrolase family protein [Opitutaceae bacterium]
MTPMARPKSSRLRVALVRFRPAKGDLAANYRRLLAVLRALARRRPDVVVTSECFLDGYVVTEPRVTRRTIGRYAVDPARSPLVRGVAAWARAHRCWVILGCTRHVRGGAANSALVLDRRGRLAGAYDKVSNKTPVFVAGRRFPTFRADFGRFGIMICNDRHWPETMRRLALGGARIVFNPADGGWGEYNDWMLRVRSRENETPIAFAHPRISLVTTLDGGLALRRTGRRPPYAVADVDLAAVAAARARPDSRLRRARRQFYARGPRAGRA